MRIKVIVKYLLSFLKKRWIVNDYPIEIYLNKNAGEKNVKYGARIINWAGMVSHGESKEAAFKSLKDRFNLFEENNKLPRPGTIIPLRFASTDKIDKYEDIAVDFFRIIFGVNFYDGFYSDMSTLIDLELLIEEDSDEPKEILIQKVNDIYNIDISNIYDEPLWKVLKIISKKCNYQ